jgi:hypothetical protein
MTAPVTAVSERYLDNLLQTIARAKAQADGPPSAETSAAHTFLWQRIGDFLHAAPVDKVLEAIKSGTIPLEDDQMGSPLGEAALRHLSHLIEPLAAAGCPVSKVGAEDMTPLEHALANSTDNPNGDTVRALLKLGAAGSRSESILNYAAYCGHPRNVEAVLDHGADPNEPCPVDGTTPLVTCMRELDVGERMLETIKLLLKRGADPTKPSKEPRKKDAYTLPVDALAGTSSFAATEADLDEIMGLMLRPNLTPDDFLAAGARTGIANDELALCALKRGGRPDPVLESDRRNETIFQRFAIKGMVRSVEFMIEHCGETAGQLSAVGTPLIELVNDEDTLIALTSRRTEDLIGCTLDARERETTAPARPQQSFSL